MERWNLDTTWVQMEAVCVLSLEAPSHVIVTPEAENWKKVDNFEPIFLGNYQYGWKKVCGFWTLYLPSFASVIRIFRFSAKFADFSTKWVIFVNCPEPMRQI